MRGFDDFAHLWPWKKVTSTTSFGWVTELLAIGCSSGGSESLRVSGRNRSLPSFSALSGALGRPQSFSPPLSGCQTAGCESFRCSPVLQHQSSKMNLTGLDQKNSSRLCLVLCFDLRDLISSNDAFKVLKNKRRTAGSGRQPVQTVSCLSFPQSG